LGDSSARSHNKGAPQEKKKRKSIRKGWAEVKIHQETNKKRGVGWEARQVVRGLQPAFQKEQGEPNEFGRKRELRMGGGGNKKKRLGEGGGGGSGKNRPGGGVPKVERKELRAASGKT